MADRSIDTPAEQGVKGKFKRSMSGIVGKDGLPSLYADELKKELKGVDAESIFPLLLISTVFGMVGMLGGMAGGGVAYVVMDEDAAVDSAIAQGLGGEYGYQSVRMNNATVTLVQQDGQYQVYRSNGGDLVHVGSVGDALEAVRDVTSQLRAAVTALENGTIPEGDIVDFVRMRGLSEAFFEADGSIRRNVEAVERDNSANNGFLQSLQSSLTQWEQAGQVMMRSSYGISQAQEAQMFREANSDDYFVGGLTLLGGLGFLGGLTLPLTCPIGAAMKRRREIKKAAKPS